MLTFRRKYKKIKQIEVNKGLCNAWDIFHRTRSQSFACAKMASAPKKPRKTLLRRFFTLRGVSKGKTLNVFFESA